MAWDNMNRVVGSNGQVTMTPGHLQETITLLDWSDAANNGVSAYIDSNGKIIQKIESTQSGVIKISKLHSQKETIFSKNGNNIFFYLLIIYISFIFFINKRRNK